MKRLSGTIKKHKKRLILIISSALLLTAVSGATVTFLITKTTPKVNEFTPSYVSSKVEENFDGKVKTDVKLQNTGDISAYLRAAIVVTWKDKSGNVYPAIPKKGEDYNISINSDWLYSEDEGFYYWKSPIEPNGFTDVLVNSIKPVEGKTPSGYSLNVEILGDAIQSQPKNAVENSWNVIVNDDGTLKKG